MQWELVTSKENKLIRHVNRLASEAKYRRANGVYVCEGEKLLWEAVRDGVPLQAVVWEQQSLHEARAHRPEKLQLLETLGCRLVEAPANVFSAASFLETFSGPLFLCGIREPKIPETGSRFLALDCVQDPGNVGTVIRSADAFSVDGVFLLEGTADPYQPKAVRAAMGSIFRVPVYRVTTEDFFQAMQKLSLPVYAAALSDRAEPIGNKALGDAAMIVGNEGRGVRPETIARCDGTRIIPMSGNAESLNAAVAASILMWEMSRWR